MSFEGNFFKDFYYSQGDYSVAKKEEDFQKLKRINSKSPYWPAKL